MRITICDDEITELSAIGGYIDEYISGGGYDITVKKFSSPTELLEYERMHGTGDIYLLDVVMPEMNGIELGRELRQHNKKAVIIYLTTAKAFSLDAYSVRAFSYLIKPVDRNKLFAELDECIGDFNIAVKKFIIKTADGSIAVPVKDITAVEYYEHRLIYYIDGERINGIYQKKNFDEQAEPLIKTGVFVKVSASYLVNMENVASVGRGGFVMKDGTDFTITRKYADAEKKYFDFVMREDG